MLPVSDGLGAENHCLVLVIITAEYFLHFCRSQQGDIGGQRMLGKPHCRKDTCTTVNTLPPTHYCQRITVNALPSTHYCQCTTVNALPSTHYRQHTTVNALPSTHYHQHTTVNTLLSMHYHQHTTVNTLPSTHYRQHTTVILATRLVGMRLK